MSNRQQAAGSRQQAASSRQQAASSRRQAASGKRQRGVSEQQEGSTEGAHGGLWVLPQVTVLEAETHCLSCSDSTTEHTGHTDPGLQHGRRWAGLDGEVCTVCPDGSWPSDDRTLCDPCPARCAAAAAGPDVLPRPLSASVGNPFQHEGETDSTVLRVSQVRRGERDLRPLPAWQAAGGRAGRVGGRRDGMRRVRRDRGTTPTVIPNEPRHETAASTPGRGWGMVMG